MSGGISFEGQVVVVSGAGNGLGRAHALELGRRGAAVVVNDLGSEVSGTGSGTGPADQVVAEIRGQGGVAVASYDSVGSPQGCEAIIGRALEEFGRIDAVIHNAGILRLNAIEATTPDDVERHLDVHLRGGIYLTTAAFTHMCEQGYGRFVYTSSQAVFGGDGLLAYATAKGGLFGLAKVVAVEGASSGIQANVVFPAATTRMVTSLSAGQAAAIRPSGALPTSGEHDGIDHVAALVVYLASSGCSSNGGVYYASFGRYGRVVTGVGVGWAPEGVSSVDDVHAHIRLIDHGDVVGFPTSTADFGHHVRGES